MDKRWHWLARPAASRSFPPVILGLIVLTRVICRSHLLYDLDSVNFALALGRFDPSVHQPHPPGYFAYVYLGRLINSVVHDPNTALVSISIAASVAAAAAIYALTDAWVGSRAATFSLLLFLFSPLCWFHGTVALTYIVEAFFSAAVGYSCWRIQSGSWGWVFAASVLLGLSAGFRPSSLVFLLPLFVWSVRRIPAVWIWAGCFALALTLSGWFVPMVMSAGGFTAYAGALYHLWSMVPARATVFSGHLAISLARALTMLWIYVLCFASAAPLILWARSPERPDNRAKLFFTVVWIAPGVLFFTFVFLLFVNSGYLLVLSPPLFAWLAAGLDRLYVSAAANRARIIAVIAAGCLANTLWFLFAPVYCSYRSVRQFEQRMNGLAEVIRQRFDPRDTMIVAFDSHFLGYRHAGYYLAEYLTVQYPEVRYGQGMRVFQIQDRDTRLAERLNLKRYSRFIVFPLPHDAESDDYLRMALSRFHPKTLRTETVGAEVFVSGSIADLPVLFPHTMR